jgi:hypothetical protein
VRQPDPFGGHRRDERRAVVHGQDRDRGMGGGQRRDLPSGLLRFPEVESEGDLPLAGEWRRHVDSLDDVEFQALGGGEEGPGTIGGGAHEEDDARS